MLQGQRAELADLLFDIGAIKFGQFRLKIHESHPEAPLSPLYINLRTPAAKAPGPVTEPALRLMVHLLHDLMEHSGLKATYAIGLPHAGDPIAEAFVAAYPGRYQRLRLGKVTHGQQRRITGVRSGGYLPGSRAFIIDDVVSQGTSKAEAVAAARSSGLVVRGLFVVVDREQGARDHLRRLGVKLHAVLRLTQLIKYYEATERITAEQASQVRQYLRH